MTTSKKVLLSVIAIPAGIVLLGFVYIMCNLIITGIGTLLANSDPFQFSDQELIDIANDDSLSQTFVNAYPEYSVSVKPEPIGNWRGVDYRIEQYEHSLRLRQYVHVEKERVVKTYITCHNNKFKWSSFGEGVDLLYQDVFMNKKKYIEQRKCF